MKEVNDLMEIYQTKMNEIEDVKNDEEVFKSFLLINIYPFLLL